MQTNNWFYEVVSVLWDYIANFLVTLLVLVADCGLFCLFVYLLLVFFFLFVCFGGLGSWFVLFLT